MEWNYQREESTFEEIPVGEHRVRIADAQKAISKNGNDMLVLTLDVSGYRSRLWHYVVFMPDHPEITSRNLTAIFDSFGIADGDFNLANWKGKVGAWRAKPTAKSTARSLIFQTILECFAGTKRSVEDITRKNFLTFYQKTIDKMHILGYNMY